MSTYQEQGYKNKKEYLELLDGRKYRPNIDNMEI